MNVVRARVVALFLNLALLVSFVAPVAAQTAGTATINGLVIDQKSALPVSGATVRLTQGGAVTQTATTGSDGRYTITGITPGIYSITISAAGYSSSASTDVAISGTSDLNAALTVARTSDSATQVIGRVSSSASQLGAATALTQTISMQNLTQTGRIRIADQLAALPATNFSTSSSVGDDTAINLRGFGSDETASLLDGHPVGPLGVGSGGFNFSLGPAFGLSQVSVTYGSGAQGLYGSDTIGGAVNYVTLNPTAKPQESVQQQIGGFGIRSTGITATGTVDKLGYAFALGRLGEYGDFYPGNIAQSARPNNVSSSAVNPDGVDCSGQNTPTTDVSACNLAVNTYAVSQNTEQSIGLGKLIYNFSPETALKLQFYGAVQWSDSTGNGDNDNIPYSTRLNTILSGTSDCTAAGGAAGYTVTTDPIAGTQGCYTASQYASATSGPDGGGAGRQRSTSMRDYSATFTTKAGINNITLSGYTNNYVFWKYSSLAGGIDPNGQLLGTPTYADFYNTIGLLASDEITTGMNDLTFGYTTWHQLQTGVEDDASGITPNPVGYFGEYSFFANDSYEFNKQLWFFLNAWVKHSSVTGQTTFDPRATLQIRPTNRDVFQLTYGRSDGAPSPSLKLVGTVIASDPGSSLTSVNCGGFNDVASAGNPNLQSEAANDFEAGYGHRFNADSNIQVNAYVTSVANQLFGASEPLTQFGINNVTFAPGALNTYLNRLQAQCPGANITAASLPQYLSVATTYNAAHALARGLEFTGRQRFTPIAYVDYGYYIESSTKTGISDDILSSNPTTVNGAQLRGIPLHQATISLDVAPGPFEFRLDNYYTEFNNGLNRPSFWRSDAFVSYTFDKNTLFSVGGTNIFNQAVQTYGLIGYGTTPILNPVAIAAGTTASPSEEFGLAPAQLTFTFQHKF